MLPNKVYTAYDELYDELWDSPDLKSDQAVLLADFGLALYSIKDNYAKFRSRVYNKNYSGKKEVFGFLHQVLPNLAKISEQLPRAQASKFNTVLKAVINEVESKTGKKVLGIGTALSAIGATAVCVSAATTTATTTAACGCAGTLVAETSVLTSLLTGAASGCLLTTGLPILGAGVGFMLLYKYYNKRGKVSGNASNFWNSDNANAGDNNTPQAQTNTISTTGIISSSS